MTKKNDQNYRELLQLRADGIISRHLKRCDSLLLVWAMAITVLVLLSGCGPSTVEIQKFLAGARTPVGCEEYTIMPPDRVKIQATPTEEFQSLTVQVGPDGRAFLPLIGNYMLAGKSTTQIANELTENLLDYYEDVRVTVNVAAYKSKKFFVYGHAGRPGPYPFTGNDSLFSALFAAGITPLGWPERIKVIRGIKALPGEKGMPVGPDGKLKNTAQRMTINLTSMIEGNHSAVNFMLQENDIIYIPPHPLARIGLAVQKVLFPFSPLIQAAKSPYDFYDNATNADDNE